MVCQIRLEREIEAQISARSCLKILGEDAWRSRLMKKMLGEVAWSRRCLKKMLKECADTHPVERDSFGRNCRNGWSSVSGSTIRMLKCFSKLKALKRLRWPNIGRRSLLIVLQIVHTIYSSHCSMCRYTESQTNYSTSLQTGYYPVDSRPSGVDPLGSVLKLNLAD